jgi:hypothetical protein
VTRCAVRRALICATVAACVGANLVAQRVLPAERVHTLLPAFRTDIFVGTAVGAQVAAGLIVAPAYNVRLQLDLGAGGVPRASGWVSAGRAEFLMRWVSDPFRRSRWAVHAGGGAGVAFESLRAARPLAVVTLGLEGPVHGRWQPGIELGLGGGVRAGLTLRAVRPGRR